MAASGNSASNWFSSLASKAENVLNQIDESAATALSAQQNEESGNDGKGQNASNTGFKQQKKPPLRSRQMKRTAGSAQKVISQQLEPFSTEAPLSSSDHIRRMSSNSVDVNTTVTSSSRPSSVSSTKSNKSEGALPLFVDPFSQHSSAVASVSNIGKRINRSETGDGGEQEHSPKSGNEDSFSQVTSNSGSSYLQVDPHNDSITLAYEEDSNIHAEMLSSLSQENKLLKSELQSLSQELHTALNRQREAESRLRRLNEDYDLKCQEANEMFNKWQNVEMDMTEEIKARDSQIAGYRLKLNELSDKVASQNDSIQQLNNEKIRILSDHQASSGLHEESVSHLQTQLNEAQKGFNAQIESERSEKLEFEMKLMKAEENLQALTVELRDASQKLQNERQTNGDYLRQLTMSKQSLEESRTELVEYKSKAVKILQSKEKLISEMKMSFHEGPPLQMEDSVSSGDGSVDGGSGFQSPVSMMSKSQIVTGGTSQFEMMKMELNQYKYETELLREEVTRLTVQLERSRDELAACEATNNQQHMSLTHNLNATHSALQQEKHKVSMLEDELHRNKEELTVTSRELLSVKEKLSRIVAEKDQSISKLQTDLTSLKNKPGSPGNEEFESRVRTLTDTLLSKQSQIERLSSEKQSLNFQLERLSLENSSANGSIRSGSSSTRVNMMTSIFDDDGNKPRGIPAFCRESAFDNQAIKLLKKGLVAIDSFSLTVGVYFRRFALARVFIVIYALLLHLWVTLVILTYKPEMHSDDFQPQIKPIMKAE